MSKCISRIDTVATFPLQIFLAIEIRHIPVLCTWLDVRSLGVLDIAVSSHNARKPWLITLKSISCQAIHAWRHSHASLRWLMMRAIHVTQVLVDPNHNDRVSDLTFVPVGITCGRISYDDEAKYDSILSIWEERKYLLSINLSECQGITDIGLSALGRGCGQLKTIDLFFCLGFTDVGISALVAGCGQLQTINLGFCRRITDIGVSALGHGCGQLHTINLSGCKGVTNMGVSALRLLVCRVVR